MSASSPQPNRGWVEAHSFDLNTYATRPMPLPDGLAIASDTPRIGIGFDWAGLCKATGLARGLKSTTALPLGNADSHDARKPLAA
ncbi:MAG: uroporphyrinogen decarboxylase [Devosia sp.]|nr:uroporphyrinogen decarboxylase [Devosia sp.]